MGLPRCHLATLTSRQLVAAHLYLPERPSVTPELLIKWPNWMPLAFSSSAAVSTSSQLHTSNHQGMIYTPEWSDGHQANRCKRSLLRAVVIRERASSPASVRAVAWPKLKLAPVINVNEPCMIMLSQFRSQSIERCAPNLLYEC